MERSDIQSILRLFLGSPFPRTISTYATGGRQVCVTSIDEMFQRFKEANFVDCRINAYPALPTFAEESSIVRQSPDFVMSDLDFSRFRTERMLNRALNETVTNISNDLPGTVPMVLFTGGGYHVYQPIDIPALEEESIFRFFDNPSTEFIRYAAQRWTNGKNDACNRPSIKSCLLRVPGSTNSKNLKSVEIVQEWNGRRPLAKQLLMDFYIKSAAKRLASGFDNLSKGEKGYYVSPTSKNCQLNHKTYRHPGHIPRDPADRSTVVDGITWIDNILGNGGIADHRKVLVDLVIVPYLVNIKQCDFDDAYDKVITWLDRCGQKRRLDFNARLKVKYALNRSRLNGIRPMRLDTMREKYFDAYQEVISTH